MLGYERLTAAKRQPGTLEFILDGYRMEDFDLEQAQAMLVAARNNGLVELEDIGEGYTSGNPGIHHFFRARGRNMQHIPGASSETSETQSDANIRGRQSLLRILRFLKTIPGGEKTSVAHMAPVTAIRETYRIVGEATITHEDYMTGRMFEDAIVWSPFFIDVHSDHGGMAGYLKPGTRPTIPFGALIPKGSTSLLVAGRCLSSDRPANGGTREQPYCMAMGEAAGTAAAMAVKKGTASKDIDINELRLMLKQNGAIVPEQV
jgi:hypothetical protein